MGLALCHSVPRDRLVLLALLFFLVAFILEAIAIGRHTSQTSAGYFTDKNSADSKARVGFIGGHVATYVLPTGAAASSGYAKNCNPNEALIRYHCSRFAEAYHLLNGLVLASFISCVLFIIVALFVVVRVSRTTTNVLYHLHFLAGLPTALQCAVIAIFFVRVVPNAKKDFLTSVYATSAAPVKLAFHRRYASNLMIAATVFVCVGYVIIAVKYFLALCTRRRLKRQNAKKHNVEAMMKMHLVNDDWARQKQVLRSHAKSVQVEMEIRKEDGAIAQDEPHERHSRSSSPASSKSSSSSASVPASAGGHRRHPRSKRTHDGSEDGFRFKKSANTSYRSTHQEEPKAEKESDKDSSVIVFSEMDGKSPRLERTAAAPVAEKKARTKGVNTESHEPLDEYADEL